MTQQLLDLSVDIAGKAHYDAFEVKAMDTKKFVYYEDGGMFIGWLDEYPDYWTQGETLDELVENLKDIYSHLSDISKPRIWKVGELQLPEV